MKGGSSVTMMRLVETRNDLKKKYDERRGTKCNAVKASARLSRIFLEGEVLK